MDPPPAPQAETSGPRRLEFPKSTIPVMQIEDTNNISKVDSKNVASPVEKGNESIPPSRTAAGKNDYFFHDLKEWVPNNVAEALYMMGPTAELKRTRSHKGRTRTGYQSRLFHCAIKGCSMRCIIATKTPPGMVPILMSSLNRRTKITTATKTSSWVSKGEAKLAETFEGVYISNPDYNQWYYTSSGIRGCVPDNNPLESHNGATKGTSDVRGLIIINRSMENALQVEFPRMIDTLSREKIIPNTDFHPTLDITLAFSNNNFLKLREEYLADGTTTQYNGGWLVNDTDFLGEPITPQSISCYETSLLGVFHDSYTKRQGVGYQHE
ncbi:hypothetical protein IV203_012465 [Nitzschia inconspicua]|uniref:Uncharacterized protein n=1 Tax=Nitzschia inconspicua TaxID=303405 RepID=A0A9K3KTW9_9STRA|nr:hypothetical protein IV203_012465 [Nitzschia inconspicua]